MGKVSGLAPNATARARPNRQKVPTLTPISL